MQFSLFLLKEKEKKKNLDPPEFWNFKFFFFCDKSQMDHIPLAARSFVFLEISLSFIVSYDMTDGTRNKWIQTQVHLHNILSPLPLLFF